MYLTFIFIIFMAFIVKYDVDKWLVRKSNFENLHIYMEEYYGKENNRYDAGRI